jgi:uncharacterized protein (TIGR03085 family)
MATPTYPAQQERAALCDLFTQVGPDAPTLCGEWTTRDLAAHLVVREHRPDAAVGIMISQAAGHTAKVQAGVASGTKWPDLIEMVRSGPPKWSPTRIAAIDKATNTVEFFVHHEDVRRAGGIWEPRELDPELSEALHSMVAKMAKRLVKSSTVGIVLDAGEGHDPIVAKKADPSVTVTGGIGELVMFVFGRQAHSQVSLCGDETSIEAVQHAKFGV